MGHMVGSVGSHLGLGSLVGALQRKVVLMCDYQQHMKQLVVARYFWARVSVLSPTLARPCSVYEGFSGWGDSVWI